MGSMCCTYHLRGCDIKDDVSVKESLYGDVCIQIGDISIFCSRTHARQIAETIDNSVAALPPYSPETDAEMLAEIPF